MKRIESGLLSAFLLGSFSINLLAVEELDLITVESTTIDDKFNSKSKEVSNVMTINSNDIEKINPTNVEDVLKTIPGITASNVGNDRVKIHIRGVDNHRYMGEKPGVAVVIDGVPVQQTSGKIDLDLDNIASIKVIKGGASYLYGNDAIGGAVIITTKRPKGESSSKIETEAGSFGFKRMLLSTNQSFENSDLQLQGSIRDSDGYWADAYLKHKSINGKYQYYLNETSDLTFGLDYTKRKTGDGTSVHGESNAILDPTSNNDISYSAFYDTSLVKTFLTYSNDLDDTSNIMVNVSRYKDHTTNLSTPVTDSLTHKTFRNEECIQNTLKGEYRKSFDTFAFMAGVDIARNRQTNNSKANVDYTSGYGRSVVAIDRGTITSDSRLDENIEAFYGELQNQLTSNLTSTLNIRHDRIKYNFVDNLNYKLNVAPSYNVNSYRAGLNYKINDNHSAYTSFSTGFRTPTASQISGNQEGIAKYPDANIPSSLDSEKTYNYELGIKGKSGLFDYDAAIYQIDRKNYLGTKAGSYIWGGIDDEDGYTFNMGDIKSRGFELALNSDKKKDLSFDLAYTYLDSTFKEYSIVHKTANALGFGRSAIPAQYSRINLAGNQVPRTSKHTLNFIIDYKATDKLTISPEISARSSYYADEMNKFKQGGYTLMNLRANYKFSKSLEFFAKIDNLLNKNYYQFTNVSSSSFDNTMEDATIRVAAPRAYYIGLRYKF